MAVFPLFVDLRGKECVVFGGGKVAERKITVLLEGGPQITVVSPKITENLKQFHQLGNITVVSDHYQKKYLEGAFLVIAATDDERINESIYQDAVRNQLLVNVVDNPAQDTFIFPAVIRRDDLVIGISTSGVYPALTKGLRKKIEQAIPHFDPNAWQALKECREKAGQEIPDPQRRAIFLNQIADAFLAQDTISVTELRDMIDALFWEYDHEKKN